jgi:DNA-binding CsgD family transcriptional regulator
MRSRTVTARRRGSTRERMVALTRRLGEEADARRLAEVALGAALEAFAGSAFLVAPDGTVKALDDTARTSLDGDGEAFARRVVRAARGHDDDATLVARAIGGDGSCGHVVLRSDAGRAFTMRLDRAARSWRLTARHTEVAALIVRGLCNKEIAARLDCAVHTVELHVTEMLKRSRLATRGALIAAFWSGERHLPGRHRPP